MTDATRTGERTADAAFAELTRAAGLPDGIEPGSRLGQTLAVVEALKDRLPAPGLPPITPRPGQTDAEWLADVARARAEHNAYAVEYQGVVREETRRRLGELGGGILSWETPRGVRPPAPEDVDIAVDAAALAASVDGMPEFTAAASALEGRAARWTVHARVQRPADAAPFGDAPAIVELHGGAFWMGDGECLRALGDPSAKYLAARTGAVVVTVDYRLAPEHAYPEPILDALAALDWVRANARVLGTDPARTVLAGTSSGGNVAAATALVDAARRRPGPALAGVVLTAPALDLTDFGTFYSSTPERRAARTELLRAYTGAVPASAPTVSPARHAAPATFPPSVVVTSEFDEVAAGSASWAASLAEAGVPVRHGVFPMTHTLGHPADERRMREFVASGFEWVLGLAS